jgi:transposase
MRRSSLESFVMNLRRCVVAMEACCGAHHLGRVFAAQGHEVRLMSPEYVRPYVKAQKNDDLDAEAIAEAASRPTMRFVEVKSQVQSDIQALHRARERLVGGAHRTDQSSACVAAGAWDRGAAGSAQIGRTAFDFRG